MWGIVACMFNIFIYFIFFFVCRSLSQKISKAIEFQVEKMYTCSIFLDVKI